MSKRTFLEIRRRLLKELSDGEEHSYGSLERKVNTNWKTIRMHCEDLKLFNVITISKNKVKITKFGLGCIKKLKH